MQKPGDFKNKITNFGNNTISDADFADFIYTALTIHGVSQDAFRDHFGLSKDAVERWILGKNLPQPMVRAKVLAWVAQQLPPD